MKRSLRLAILPALALTSVVLAQAPPPVPAAAPAPLKLTLKWTTASEVDNAGFYVFRGDTKEGPFKLLNETMLPGAGNAETPSKYVFDDKDVEQGRTYYYYLESISLQGVKEKFSPVMSRTCCGQPGTAKVEEKDPPSPPATPAPSPSPAPKP